jgi:hypothetical protein
MLAVMAVMSTPLFSACQIQGGRSTTKFPRGSLPLKIRRILKVGQSNHYLFSNHAM